MYRGIAAEFGIIHGLLNPTETLKECIDLALKEYSKLSCLSPDPKREKEGDAVPGLVEQGILALRPYGIPDEVQKKVSYEVEGLALPFVGYCDVGWSYHGIRLDIKTQLALTSEPSDPHRRQVACYIHGTNLEGRLAYMTPKKHAVYPVRNAHNDMAALIQIARRIERFLSLSDDPTVLAELLIPDYTSFYFNNPTTRALGRETFGF